MPKKKHHTQKLVVALLFLTTVTGLAVILPDNYGDSGKTQRAILSAVSNPGRIIIYSFNGNDYDREITDAGYALVYTVVQGNARNDGKDRIYAGVSNDYFRQPYGCAVLEYEKSGNAWTTNVIDDVGDVRCKDLIIGDVDNDGKNELVLGTHGEGLINVYKWDAVRMRWNSTNIERNWVAKIDVERGTGHRVPRENLTYDAVDQTAVHIVMVGDADNDGKNELAATISSSLAYETGPQISFLNIYRWENGKWDAETVSESSGYQHRSVLIDDIDNDGKNEIVVGTSNGRLVNKLQSLGIENKTVIIIFGDHGEAFGEHGSFTHNDLYDEVLRVPLIIFVPAAGGKRVDGQVQLIDIMPTILELVGIRMPDGLKGNSLIPAIFSGNSAASISRYAYSTGNNGLSGGLSIRTAEWKLIERLNGTYELYDLKNDKLETKNVAGKMRDITAEMASELSRWKRENNYDSMRNASGQARKALEMSGYIPAGSR